MSLTGASSSFSAEAMMDITVGMLTRVMPRYEVEGSQEPAGPLRETSGPPGNGDSGTRDVGVQTVRWVIRSRRI